MLIPISVFNDFPLSPPPALQWLEDNRGIIAECQSHERRIILYFNNFYLCCGGAGGEGGTRRGEMGAGGHRRSISGWGHFPLQRKIYLVMYCKPLYPTLSNRIKTNYQGSSEKFCEMVWRLSLPQSIVRQHHCDPAMGGGGGKFLVGAHCPPPPPRHGLGNVVVVERCCYCVSLPPFNTNYRVCD